MFLQQHCVSCIALVQGVCDVAEEWDEADHKVDNDVELHLTLDRRGKTAVDTLAGSEDHVCHHEIESVTGTIEESATDSALNGKNASIQGYDANDTAPAEAYPTAVEQTEVEPIRTTLDLGENVRIILRDARWKSLAPLLCLLKKPAATETLCGYFFEVRILRDISKIISNPYLMDDLTS